MQGGWNGIFEAIGKVERCAVCVRVSLHPRHCRLFPLPCAMFLQQRSKIWKAVFCCIQCCMWCFEKCLKFIT